MRLIIYNIFIWWSVIGMGIWLGGTVFSMSVIVPMWSKTPPDSVRFFFGQTTFNKYIWNFFGPPWMAIRNLPLFITLITGWSFQPQREYLIIASVCTAFGIIYTLTYVYPINDALMTKAGGGNTPGEINMMVTKWIFADRLRFVIMAIGYFFLLKAFRLSDIQTALY